MTTQKRQYLFKIGENLVTLPITAIKSLNFYQALKIALDSIKEQKKQLLQDALDKDKLHGRKRVVEALEQSISKLQITFPNIKAEIRRCNVPTINN